MKLAPVPRSWGTGETPDPNWPEEAHGLAGSVPVNAVCDGRPQQRGGRDAILPTRTATAHATCSSLVDDNSPFLRLYSANEFWIPNPGAEAVCCHLQTVQKRCPGRCEGVPIPAHRSALPTLRRAAKVLALRGVPGPANSTLMGHGGPFSSLSLICRLWFMPVIFAKGVEALAYRPQSF